MRRMRLKADLFVVVLAAPALLAQPQIVAAASRSISRAVAPDFRSRSHSLATLLLPPVPCIGPHWVWL